MERKDASADAVELLNQHRRLTSRLARRFGRFDAEDLASEALARSLRRPAPDGSRQPWLERILRNLVVDRARRSRRAAVHAAELSRVTESRAAPNPEERLLSDERRRAVQAALPEIPAGLREAVERRFYEDRDYDAVAVARGISPTTARTRVHRALACLRVSLGRLRVAMPFPSLFGGAHSFSMTAALLPAALSAALVVPSLAVSPDSRTSRELATAPIVMAQNQSPVRHRAPAPPVVLEPQQPAASSASAAPAKPASSHRALTARNPAPVERSESAPQAVKRFDFDEDEVEGGIYRPEEVVVHGDTAAKHPSLIELRREFVGEIGKMIEDI